MLSEYKGECALAVSCSLDTGAAISAKRKLLDKHRLDIEEIEGNSDKEVSCDLYSINCFESGIFPCKHQGDL